MLTAVSAPHLFVASLQMTWRGRAEQLSEKPQHGVLSHVGGTWGGSMGENGGGGGQ